MSTDESNDIDLLAPRFAEAVRKALAAAHAKGYDALVHEAFRSDERQRFLYKKGRTIIPPKDPVTNAATADFSWHGYGLAIDIIHRTRLWDPPGGSQWFNDVAGIFKQHDCNWGGDWKRKDRPHFQWHLCKPSPSAEAVALKRRHGHQAVWDLVGAR